MMETIEYELLELGFYTESSDIATLREYYYEVEGEKANHSLSLNVMIEGANIKQVWLESKSQSFTLHTVTTLSQIENLITAL
jgi:hypothetical protein